MTPINHVRLLGWERSTEAVDLAPNVEGVLVVAEHRETGDYMYATPCLQQVYFSSAQEWEGSLFSTRVGHRKMTKVSELDRYITAYDLIKLYGGMKEVKEKLRTNWYEGRSHAESIQEWVDLVESVGSV